MAVVEICCPGCGHTWDDEDVCEDVVTQLEEQITTLTADMAEMREFLKGIVDEFDKTPSVYSINRVLTKAEIMKMRRLVERTT